MDWGHVVSLASIWPRDNPRAVVKFDAPFRGDPRVLHTVDGTVFDVRPAALGRSTDATTTAAETALLDVINDNILSGAGTLTTMDITPMPLDPIRFPTPRYGGFVPGIGY